MFDGKVKYKELDEFSSLRRISQREWLAFKWTVNPILNYLKNRTICWHVDNMNVHQARLNSSCIRDSWLSKQIR